MKIAQISPLVESVPPKKYGGTERIIYTLTEELIKRGHEVTLFASGDSKTNAQLIPGAPKALRRLFPNNKKKWIPKMLTHLKQAYQDSWDFDLIHDHTGYDHTRIYGAPFAERVKAPVVVTLHGIMDSKTVKTYQKYPKPQLVSISHAQQKAAPNLNYIGNVYHGLDMAAYPFSKIDDGYLLHVGRICPEKGTHIAVQVALKLGLPLIIAAKLERKINGKYFDREIAPYLGKKIKWVGEVNEKIRNKLYSKAICLLHPVTWPEPFGLTLIEAMACGCPVIALSEGSIPELVYNGISGYAVKTQEEMIKAVSKISKIDRFKCRSWALKKYSAERMVDEYEDLYYKILSQKSKLKPTSSDFYPKPLYLEN